MTTSQATADHYDPAPGAATAYDTPLGITNPPIDELLDRVSSKYALVIYAAKRARQINDYYNQLGDGILEYVGPWSSRVCRRSRCRSRCARSTATCSSTPKASNRTRAIVREQWDAR